jgi:hypothetical protein
MDFLLLLAQNGGDVAWGVGGFFLVWILLAAAALVVWIWALVDALQNPSLDSTMRIVWVLVILLANVLGAIIYLLVGRTGRRVPG